MKEHWVTFARYSAWANGLVYDHAAGLGDRDYRSDRGAFFRSVHGTLNHLLTTDRIWMKRFTGEGDAPNRLDAILFESFPDLRAAREAEDARIIRWVESLDEADFSRTFQYQRISTPERFEQELAPALAHFFNHQTHHRGQLHMLFTSLTGAGPELDLLIFERESDRGARAIG